MIINMTAKLFGQFTETGIVTEINYPVQQPVDLRFISLKWHASWVQNVVRQFGLYLSWAQEI